MLKSKKICVFFERPRNNIVKKKKNYRDVASNAHLHIRNPPVVSDVDVVTFPNRVSSFHDTEVREMDWTLITFYKTSKHLRFSNSLFNSIVIKVISCQAVFAFSRANLLFWYKAHARPNLFFVNICFPLNVSFSRIQCVLPEPGSISNGSHQPAFPGPTAWFHVWKCPVNGKLWSPTTSDIPEVQKTVQVYASLGQGKKLRMTSYRLQNFGIFNNCY